MIIVKCAVGNKFEAYIEDRFCDGFNIISSDDNNKGKTIVIQSILYALGNEPSFPVSFEYKQYYYYLEIENNNILYKICRHADCFIVRYQDKYYLFDSVSEFKHFWNDNIFKLPSIVKDGRCRIVDPILFLQLFFVGQDRKDTSNIVGANYYNKQDFMNMVFSMMDIGGVHQDSMSEEQIRSRVKQLKAERQAILKEYKILTSSDIAVSYLSTENDRINFSKKVEELTKKKDEIVLLKNERNRIMAKKMKWEVTLKELISLNRNIGSGELRCLDCNSTHIGFRTGVHHGYSFDVSTVEMRNDILGSINSKIVGYEEDLCRLNNELKDKQAQINSMLSEESITLESLVYYKQDIFDAHEADIHLNDIDREINELNNTLKGYKQQNNACREAQDKLVDNIVDSMRNAYRNIDSNGNLNIEYLFTKKSEIYSGSEMTIFYLIKLYALNDVISHSCPIIMDSFRAEDLSSDKEASVLKLYSKLHNQIIFTTTLKKEELGKYDDIPWINSIDYCDHVDSKMLSDKYLDEFNSLLEELYIEF